MYASMSPVDWPEVQCVSVPWVLSSSLLLLNTCLMATGPLPFCHDIQVYMVILLCQEAVGIYFTSTRFDLFTIFVSLRRQADSLLSSVCVSCLSIFMCVTKISPKVSNIFWWNFWEWWGMIRFWWQSGLLCGYWIIFWDSLSTGMERKLTCSVSQQVMNGGVWRGPKTSRLEFNGNPDHDPDPGTVDAEMFCCPGWLINLSLNDISILLSFVLVSQNSS